MLLTERQMSVSQLAGWAERRRLYGVIDATDTPSVPERARLLGESRAVSLYRGSAEETLFAIAPYLVQLDWTLLEWITTELWTQPWGMFVFGDASIETLRTHFRQYLTVSGPQGESWYFRFYDPRVLRKYLASCTADELAAFYGPVRGYGVTDPETYGVSMFTRGEKTEPTPRATPSVVVLT